MLTHLRLRDFRCFDTAAVEFAPDATLFLGANGEGKTTILEAACVLLRLQSQRSTSLAPAVQIGKKSFLVAGDFDGHELEFRYGPLRRRVTFDHIEQRTLGEYLRIARVVSFANSDIDLVRGSSETRRRYLDFLGSQINPGYRPTLRSYERTLRARNALLKSPVPRPTERAAYDLPLVQHGAQLVRFRKELAILLSPLTSNAYKQITGGREKFELRFFPGVGENFAHDLEQSREEELRLRQTVVGPHRDDLALLVDEMPAPQFGSEGQQRSVALALKVAQARAFEITDDQTAPLLLVDDIFGELDIARRNALLDNLPAASQKLITATAMPWRDNLPAGTIYELQDRRLGRL